MTRALSIALVLPFGEPRESFFPDVIAELCAQRARALGHRAEIVRAYYDGRDESRDAEVSDALESWLRERAVDVVVVERLFDPAPIRRHVAAAPGRCAVLVSWGDAEPIEGVEWVVGLTPGLARRGDTRRSPSGGELVHTFGELVEALARGADPSTVPGLARFDGERVVPGPPSRTMSLPRPFEPVVEHNVLSAFGTVAPRVTRKFLLGNAGCPFAKDPSTSPFYRGLTLLDDGTLSRLGCAFCHAGGDYQKRADAEVVEELVLQALYYRAQVPELEELVLVDQHPLRYLAQLVRRAHEAGLGPMRWLFPARADSFVREQDRVRDAIDAARATGHTVEVYLSGFESFSERELERYNKGVGAADLARAVEAMRALRADAGGAFEHARARGHSLILWSPWTSPEDLDETVRAVRAQGLSEMFSELGRNRLRLYRELPIFLAAERDGALADAWQEGDGGAGRRKGYAVEHPWRFLDSRTRLAYALALGLRDRLGPETEVSQLAAVAAYTVGVAIPDEEVPAHAARVLAAVEALDQRLTEIMRARGRAPTERASVVRFAGACDNACAGCANRDRWLDDSPSAVLARLAQAREADLPIVLAGREPAVHPAFLELVRAAAGPEGRAVGVVTNGRRLGRDGLARAAHDAGLRAASVKLFGPDAAIADGASGVMGSHHEALAGLSELARVGVVTEHRVSLGADSVACIDRYAELGASRIRVEVALDRLGLARVEAAVRALDALARRCAGLGVCLDASALGAGSAGFDRMLLPARV
jgi:hypothetical protein